MSTVRDGRGILIELDGSPRLAQGSGASVALRRHDFDPVLPCVTCLHHDVCRIREQLEGTKFGLLEPVLPVEVRIGVMTTVDCDYFEERQPRLRAVGSEPLPPEFAKPLPLLRGADEAPADEPAALPVAIDHRSGKLGPAGIQRDRLVIAALQQSSSLRDAAQALGVSLTAVKARIADLRARGALPAHLEERIASRDRAHGFRRSVR